MLQLQAVFRKLAVGPHTTPAFVLKEQARRARWRSGSH